MRKNKPVEQVAEPLLEIDRKARELFLPYRKTPAVRVIAWLSEIGDQPQLRLLAGGTLAVGVLRSDPRMIRAGARMLIAHEAATWAKTLVKDRVIRLRPRSAADAKEQKPRAGRDKSKEKSSFPSGHSAGAVAVACAFAAEYPEHKGLAYGAAGAVALAQIPRETHYPTDVAAGATIGIATDAAVGALWRWAARRLAR